MSRNNRGVGVLRDQYLKLLWVTPGFCALSVHGIREGRGKSRWMFRLKARRQTSSRIVL